MAPPWPWLPADLQPNYGVRLRATADRSGLGIVVDGSELVVCLETVLDELDPAIAATWIRILDHTSSFDIERAALVAALDAIDADMMPSWIPVRTALAAFAADIARVFVDVWETL
jgi:hypothetical protein